MANPTLTFRHSSFSVRVLAILTLTLFNLAPQRTDGAICEPIRIAMCVRAMPYNITQMPNLLYHSTQLNAQLVLEQYADLVASNCSKSLLFYLCAMFAPVCPTNFYQVHQDAIPPCQSVCLDAKRGCEPVLRRYNLGWPREFDCAQLPTYERSVCITPDAIDNSLPMGSSSSQIETESLVRGGGEDGFVQDQRASETSCNCKNPQKIRSAYLKKNFHYVIRATYKRKQGSAGHPVHIKLHAQEVFKNSTVPITLNRSLSLWSPTGCLCFRFKRGSDYLIMGFEDPRHLLLYDDKSIVMPWKKNWPQNIKRWEHRLQEIKKSPSKKPNTVSPKSKSSFR